MWITGFFAAAARTVCVAEPPGISIEPGARSEGCDVPTFGFDYLHANELKDMHATEDLALERF